MPTVSQLWVDKQTGISIKWTPQQTKGTTTNKHNNINALQKHYGKGKKQDTKKFKKLYCTIPLILGKKGQG